VTRFDPKHPSRIVLRLVPFIIEATSADVQVWAMMERMLAAPRRRPRATRSRLLDCRSRRRPSRVQIPGVREAAVPCAAGDSGSVGC